MKNVTKILAILLAVCMLAPCMAVGASFTDVDNASVKSLADKGIIKGYSAENFAPDDICTRGQFLTFLWRATGEPAAEKAEAITDITGEEYYANAVWWAYKNGITKIYSDGTFKADAPTDREHAAYYLYQWAKLFDKSDVTKTMSLNDYLEDATSISADSRTAFSWAMANGLLEECEGSLVKPKDAVNRLWTVSAIAALLDNHVCRFSDWTDNGDGTHTRTCTKDASHKETKEHNWNDGELTKAPTETEKGLITYTCHDCKLTKTEDAAPGTEFVTRADLEEALSQTAFAYFSKGPKFQYDSTHLTDMTAYLGGLARMSCESAPELSTTDNRFFSVCSDFTHQCYYEGLGIKDMGETTWTLGFSTSAYFVRGDNQNQTQTYSSHMIEPVTEEDVKTSLFRWVDFDQYRDYKGDTVISQLMSYGVFDSSSFTELTPELTFKDDGFEGEVHYSYYDKDGNIVSYAEVRTQYLDPIIMDHEKFFRAGDIIVDQGHALIYVGNGRLVHCSSYKGGKVNTTTGEAPVAPDGAIIARTPVEEYTNFAKYSGKKSLIALRPLEFVVKMGYDEDPANDIVKDLEVPEKTKSRIKYPMMDIDRTVDITHYGTVTKGDNLTYTVAIANKTDMNNYQTWKGEGAACDYENLVVTETIPEGCEYVEGSATNGGQYKNGVITWNLAKVAPGETVSLTYSVKVTAEIGSTIVNDGGMVDNIPSNVIKNTVGGEKLSEQSSAALSEIAAAGNEALAGFGADADFANAIYKQIGEELTLPSVGDMTKELFPIKSHVPGYAQLSWVPQLTPINLYENKVIENTQDNSLKQMVVSTFWGGRKFYVGDALKWNYADNCIKEFRPDYLEAGDIIIYAITNDKTNLSYDFDTVCVMVYDGKNLLSSTKTSEGTTYEIFGEDVVQAQLTKLLMKDKDLFFALRPSNR